MHNCTVADGVQQLSTTVERFISAEKATMVIYYNRLHFISVGMVGSMWSCQRMNKEERGSVF